MPMTATAMAEGYDGVLPEFFGLGAVTDTARAAVAQFGADLKATAARDVTRCEAAGAAHPRRGSAPGTRG